MKIHLTYITVIVLLGAGLFYYFDQNRKHKEESERKDSVIDEKNAVIAYSMDREKRIIATKDAAVIAYTEIAKAYPAVMKDLESLNLEVKDLKAYTRSGFQARGSGNSTVVATTTHDSTTGKTVSTWELKASDGYLDFRSTVLDSLNAPYTYTYSDTIVSAFYTKRKWLLGNQKMYAASRLSNPNAKVTNTTNLMVDSFKDKRWTLGPGISYDPISNTFHPTVTLSYAVFRF